MKKIGKKKILGIALLTSLSIFAGTTANNITTTAPTTNNTVNDECKLQKDSNGNLVDENGNIIKKPDPAKIEELKAKLNNGKITKAEGAEIAKMLDRRGPHKPNDKCKPKDAPKRLTDTEIQSLTDSLNSGKVTKDEAAKLIEMLNHRPKGPRPDNAPLN